jgi:hypothetical protein
MAVLSFDPKTKKVKQDEKRFLQLIGESITIWSRIDRVLFWICEAALGAQRQQAAIVYYRNNMFSYRLVLTDELVKAATKNKAVLAEWRKITGAIDDNLPIRNAIAHNPPKRTGTSKKGRAVYLYAIAVEPAELMRGKKKEFDVTPADMRTHIRQVTKLGKRMLRFLRRFPECES